MVTVFSTGDRESDLALWRDIRTSIKGPIATYDCAIEAEKLTFLGALDSLSMFAQEQNATVAHFLEVDAALKKKLLEFDGVLYLISAKGDLPPQTGTKLNDSGIKIELSKLLSTHKVILDRSAQNKLYAHLSSEDEKGKDRLSPLLFSIFKRRLEALTANNEADSSQLIKEILELTKEPVNQWDLLKRLFTYDKKIQLTYFQGLLQQMSVFEILAYAKSTLSLVLCILEGKRNGIDSVSIATKIKKNPFYISNIVRTIQEEGITLESAYRLLTRFMNLEYSLKSGKFDDEQFGFEVLLATN